MKHLHLHLLYRKKLLSLLGLDLEHLPETAFAQKLFLLPVEVLAKRELIFGFHILDISVTYRVITEVNTEN